MTDHHAAYEGDWDPVTNHARISYDPGDGHRQPVDHVVRHSPDGLAWGYHGSGPADTALTILTHAARRHGVDHPLETAEALHQAFKRDHVAILDLNRPFRLPATTVDQWLTQHHQTQRLNGRTTRTGDDDRSVSAADVAALRQRVSALEARLTHRARDIDDNLTLPWGGNPQLPTNAAIRVPARPVRDQLTAVMIDTGDTLPTVAQGLGLNDRFAADILDGHITHLGPVEIATVCHALHCTPYDLWPPTTVDHVLHVYPPDLWPRDIFPLTPHQPEPAIEPDPVRQPPAGPEHVR